MISDDSWIIATVTVVSTGGALVIFVICATAIAFITFFLVRKRKIKTQRKQETPTIQINTCYESHPHLSSPIKAELVDSEQYQTLVLQRQPLPIMESQGLEDTHYNHLYRPINYYNRSSETDMYFSDQR